MFAGSGVRCPSCSYDLPTTDMKYNGTDDSGSSYECYKCSNCGTRFTLSYDVNFQKDESSLDDN